MVKFLGAVMSLEKIFIAFGTVFAIQRNVYLLQNYSYLGYLLCQYKTWRSHSSEDEGIYGIKQTKMIITLRKPILT